jgi:long-chain fatty acid transport protein
MAPWQSGFARARTSRAGFVARLAHVAVLLVLGASGARAGGMELPVRGVRSLEQAGALVAGASDADALWLDPAGLAHGAGDGKEALLFDVAFVGQAVDYTRIDSGGGVLPSVSNQQPGSVVPTLAASLGIGERLVIAGGIATPYAGLHRYADTGPQRYASVSLAGSTFVMATLGAAYAVSDRLRLGATVEDMVTSLDARVVVSACPGPSACAPEDPAFDALARLEQHGYLSPSGSIGIQYDLGERITLGGVVHAPTWITGSGTLQLAVPSAAAFRGARVAGDRAVMRFWLPPSVRIGIELRPTSRLRVEAAVDVELWSLHDHISITPEDVTIQNAPGGATYVLGAMRIPRAYTTSVSPSLGAEYHVGSATLGAGLAYETAAAPAADVSVLTVDAPKWLVGAGGGYDAEGWQIGGAVGFAKLAEVEVGLADGKVVELQPLRGTPADVVVNAGTYRSFYVLAGLRAARRF